MLSYSVISAPMVSLLLLIFREDIKSAVGTKMHNVSDTDIWQEKSTKFQEEKKYEFCFPK